MGDRFLVDWAISVAVHERVTSLARYQSLVLTGLLKAYLRQLFFTIKINLDADPTWFRTSNGTVFVDDISSTTSKQARSITAYATLVPVSHSFLTFGTSLMTQIVALPEVYLSLNWWMRQRVVSTQFLVPWWSQVARTIEACTHLVSYHVGVLVDRRLLMDVV